MKFQGCDRDGLLHPRSLAQAPFPLSLGLFAAGHFVQLTVEVDREELSLLFIVALIREFDKLWLLSVVFV